jgi:hypothetical protein
VRPTDFLLAARGFLAIEPFTEAQRRSAALMARTGVEAALDSYWGATRYELRRCSRKTQLLCLAELSNPHTSQAVELAWRTLSDLCHYRPYQITPLASEIDNATTLAEKAVLALESAGLNRAI